MLALFGGALPKAGNGASEILFPLALPLLDIYSQLRLSCWHPADALHLSKQQLRPSNCPGPKASSHSWFLTSYPIHEQGLSARLSKSIQNLPEQRGTSFLPGVNVPVDHMTYCQERPEVRRNECKFQICNIVMGSKIIGCNLFIAYYVPSTKSLRWIILFTVWPWTDDFTSVSVVSSLKWRGQQSMGRLWGCSEIIYVTVFEKSSKGYMYPIFFSKSQHDHLQAFEEFTLHRRGMLAKFQLMVNLIAQLCEGRMWGPWWCFICHLRSGCLSPGTNVTPAAGETGPGSWHSGRRGLARSRRSSLIRRQVTSVNS